MEIYGNAKATGHGSESSVAYWSVSGGGSSGGSTCVFDVELDFILDFLLECAPIL